MPDVASAPGNLTVSGWRCQPFAFGSGTGSGTSVGAVLSSLIVLVTFVSPPSLTALQLSVVPNVSALTVLVSQPSVSRMVDSGSVTIQLAVTFVTYQPFVPSVPTVTGVTTGGVGSPGTSGALAAPGVRSRAVTARRTGAGRRRMSSATWPPRTCYYRSGVRNGRWRVWARRTSDRRRGAAGSGALCRSTFAEAGSLAGRAKRSALSRPE